MTLPGVALMLSAIALVWSPAVTFFAIDSCLDAGGSFNYTEGACDFGRSHHYLAKDNTARFSLAGVLAFIGVAVTIAARHGHRSD